MKIFRMFAAARHSLPRVLPLMRDARVPVWLKLMALSGAALIVSPLDILGDIPFIGIFDDVALLALLANWFVSLAERSRTRNVTAVVEPRRVTPAGLPM